MLTPSSNVRVALINDDVVALDLAHDRYLALPGALTKPEDGLALWPAALAHIHPSAASVLIDAEILIDGAGEPRSVPRPKRQLREASACNASPRDLLHLLASVAWVGSRLLRRRHCRSFDEERLPPFSDSDEDACARALEKLSLLRILIPTPGRCLPAALVAGGFLRRRGIEVEVVFGVRGHPFEAHCWLQRGEVVIDDELDRVTAYTPIAVGRL